MALDKDSESDASAEAYVGDRRGDVVRVTTCKFLGIPLVLADGTIMTWSAAKDGEKQIARAAFSKDNGLTWSQPVNLFEFPAGKGSVGRTIRPRRQQGLHPFLRPGVLQLRFQELDQVQIAPVACPLARRRKDLGSGAESRVRIPIHRLRHECVSDQERPDFRPHILHVDSQDRRVHQPVPVFRRQRRDLEDAHSRNHHQHRRQGLVRKRRTPSPSGSNSRTAGSGSCCDRRMASSGRRFPKTTASHGRPRSTRDSSATNRR